MEQNMVLLNGRVLGVCAFIYFLFTCKLKIVDINVRIDISFLCVLLEKLRNHSYRLRLRQTDLNFTPHS